MKILVVCTHGKNRSKYLAEYLIQKGYDADYAGVEQSDQKELSKKFDAANIIVTVHGSVRERLLQNFNIRGKRHIDLEAEDRPEFVMPERQQLSGNDWIAFQNNFVYPKLKEQIDKYLPF